MEDPQEGGLVRMIWLAGLCAFEALAILVAALVMGDLMRENRWLKDFMEVKKDDDWRHSA